MAQVHKYNNNKNNKRVTFTWHMYVQDISYTLFHLT